MVKTSPSNVEEAGSMSSRGSKIQLTSGPEKIKTCNKFNKDF